ncbi:MAG: GTPase HflX, partial [Cellulosilyticaceae bacterium]
MEELNKQEERFILFAAQKKRDNEEEALESLEELEELVKTAGALTINKFLQRVDSINPGYYIGTGKVEELRLAIEAYGATGVVCDDELSPVQMRNLTEALNTKVMDRTMVILDIFAQRARSREGKLQVEIAQLRYQNSRLTGFGVMLSRQGGIGSRGPGEKKLELDKRHIRARMEQLESEIKEVEKHRHLLRTRRQKNSSPVVAIVGYTNAGKSTLLNALSGSDIYAQDQLFATLDPTTRAVTLPSGTEIMVTDTVGFIRKLPHHLIKAFYSTLEEAKYADIILHVMDA